MKCLLTNKGDIMTNNDHRRKGFVSIENYWGEEVQSIIVVHHSGNMEGTEGFVKNIKQGGKEESVFHFYYQTGLFSPKNTWKVKVLTINDDVYETDGFFHVLSLIRIKVLLLSVLMVSLKQPMFHFLNQGVALKN